MHVMHLRRFTSAAAPRHLLKINDLTRAEVNKVLSCAADIKSNPQKYRDAMERETLLMLFEKPSLRTRLSFETGMTQMGGHAIFYSIADSPLGQKETFADTSKVMSRYVTLMMARVNHREHVAELARHASVPVINALDDWAHPCQILADFQTIVEKKGALEGVKMAYVGDIRNNVTYDLMRGAALTGMHMSVAGPPGADYQLEEGVLEECAALAADTGSHVEVASSAEEAVRGADVVYTDTFMSYHLDKSKTEERLRTLMPFQVTSQLMSLANNDAIFMHCLPAQRGVEVTADVMDGQHSVVFDEAENRLHAQKALMLFLTSRV